MGSQRLGGNIQTASNKSKSRKGALSAPEVFRQFENLPIEIRLSIWEYILPEARVIELEWGSRFKYDSLDPYRETPRAFLLL